MLLLVPQSHMTRFLLYSIYDSPGLSSPTVLHMNVISIPVVKDIRNLSEKDLLCALLLFLLPSNKRSDL